MGAERIIFFGSRTWSYPEIIAARIATTPADAIIVHGACPKGADDMADFYARQFGRAVEWHPADWDTFGKSAGMRRNRTMAESGASLAVGFRAQGESRGTDNMEAICVGLGIRVEKFGWWS